MVRHRWTASTVETSDGISLAVRTTGAEKGRPTVVLLTGLGTPQQAWDRVARLLPSGYRIVTFDYRGHARSGVAPSYSFESYLDDVRTVLRDHGGDRPILCGWSIGADLALWHAARNPQSCAGVLALDGGIPADPTAADDEWIRRKMNSVPARIAEWIARVTRTGLQISVDQLLAVTKDVEAARTRILDAYAELTCPVVVALGARQNVGKNPEASAAAWREGATRLTSAEPSVPVLWLDSDHAIPLRQPARVAELITEMPARAGAR